jgi:hypothetical protein
MMALFASGASDSTDVVEVQVTSDRFLRRDLHLGPSRIVTVTDTARRGDSLATRRMRQGDGRLAGTVASALGKPIDNAQVGIAGGPQTRTNERGQWALSDLPLGTRMLQVRAVTFYPEYRPIDIIEGAPPVNVALTTFKAILDTVRIVEERVRNLNANGFEERRRSQMGRFFTEADIARRNPFYTTDIFRNVPGVRQDSREGWVTIRGPFGECEPTFYLDGKNLSGMGGLDADAINMWVSPKEIRGVEIYVTNPPPQFQQALGGCGSIVIWTKTPNRRR